MKRTFRLFFLLILTVAFGLTAFGQNTSRETLRDQIQARRAELAALEKEFLAPTAEDRSDFAGLLSQPNTGVIRLLPREKYDDQIVKNKPTISMRGGGAYYSFKRLTHEYGRSDIELNSGELSVGFAGADYGMMMKLGDIAIEDVSSELPAVRTLLEYVSAKTEADARVEYRKFGMGTDVQGFMFKNRLPVEVQTTYLLRSIGFPDTDVAVAFRIARKDTDGSVILAYKLLEDFSPAKTVSR